MKRCLRHGCTNPRSTNDTHQLGLCQTHLNQFHNGTIGQQTDLKTKQRPTEEIAKIIDDYVQKYHNGKQLSCRTLGKELNVSKDIIHMIRKRKYKHIRQAAWIAIEEAIAEKEFNTNQ